MLTFKNKVAIITGGARDIGRQVSEKLAAARARVCVNYFNDEVKAQETLVAIKGNDGEAIIVKGDMAKAADVKKVIETCIAAFGNSIDILVNVAGGLMGRKLLADMDETFWDAVMDVNVKSAFLVTQAVVPHMTEGGAIVNFSSQAA